MIRNVTADLYQIGAHVPGDYGYEAVQVYLLKNQGQPILIDCGSHLHRMQLAEELDQLLEGTPLRYVFLTHSELPHAGNLKMVAERWPTIQVIVSHIMLPYIELAPVLPAAQVRTALPGSSLQVGSRTLELVDGLLKDQPGSQWVFDPETGALFTGDGFGYYESEDMLGKFSDEIPGGIPEAQFRIYNEHTFRFLRWVVPERLNADLKRLLESRDIRIIAPTHGSAIRGDLPDHVERVMRGIEAICAGYQARRSQTRPA